MGRPHGPRRKTRNLLRKHPRKRGLPPPARLLYEYAIGERVLIDIEPAVHKGMPFKRYNHRLGTIVEKRRRAYVIEIKDGGKKKLIIARPEHIRKVSS